MQTFPRLWGTVNPAKIMKKKKRHLNWFWKSCKMIRNLRYRILHTWSAWNDVWFVFFFLMLCAYYILLGAVPKYQNSWASFPLLPMICWVMWKRALNHLLLSLVECDWKISRIANYVVFLKELQNKFDRRCLDGGIFSAIKVWKCLWFS